jgi:uncharacterized protein (TIGR00156 family)
MHATKPFRRLLWPLLAAAGLSIWGGTAGAQYAGPGAAKAVTRLADILKNPVDDQWVVLRGHLIEQVSSDKYLFSDGKNRIRVEIDSAAFPARAINADTLVEISGEVEKDFLESPEIDVKRLVVLP